MDEFKFVLRCLLFTGIILFVSQYKVGNETLEAKAQYMFVESPTAETLRDTAAGGVKFIHNAVSEGTSFIKRKMAQNSGGEAHEPVHNKSNSDF